MGPLIAARQIEGEGTPESVWEAWGVERYLRAASLNDVVREQERLVVIAPHPDDEVLGAGGLLQMVHAAHRPTLLVAVTDGEASHPGSTLYRRERLGSLRRAESHAAFKSIGLPIKERRFGLPDGRVFDCEATLREHLADVLSPSDVVIATWELDGHPDHEAVGRAAISAAERVGARHLAIPIWMWHWASPGDPRVPWERAIRLDLPRDFADAKAKALLSHRTQLESDPTTGRPPILPGWALDRLLRSYEVFFR